MLVILEGNISAGKSTLAQRLGPLLGCKVFLEPTLVNPYLEKFYAEPAKYALKMQLWLLRQRFYTYVNALKLMLSSESGVILDRSVFSDKVFADQCRADGLISAEGYEYYMALRARMLAALPAPHVTLYLAVAPEECHKRIRSRSRNCESGIPLEYLAGLNSCYDAFLKDMADFGSTVVSHDWNEFGDAADIAAQVMASLPAGSAPSVSNMTTLAGNLIDPQYVRSFVASEPRIKDAMVLPYVVEGVEDSDPLPTPIDFDLEAELTAKQAPPPSSDDLVFEITFDDASSSSSSSSAENDTGVDAGVDPTFTSSDPVSRQLFTES